MTNAIAAPATGVENTACLRVEACSQDISELNNLVRRGVRPGNEQFHTDLHLMNLVAKPWGQEYRVYADDYLDVWHLRIEAVHSTSMHSHPRKVTYLLCLAGEGTSTTFSGDVPLRQGTVLRIGRGVFHGTRNTGSQHLALIEVETPRNKLDLLRLRDGYSRAGTAYEDAGSAGGASLAQPVRFLPHSHLCTKSPDGEFRFALRAGMDIFYRRRPTDLFHIPIGVDDVASGEVEILSGRPGESRRPRVDRYYLTLSSATAE